MSKLDHSTHLLTRGLGVYRTLRLILNEQCAFGSPARPSNVDYMSFVQVASRASPYLYLDIEDMTRDQEPEPVKT